MIVPDGSIVEFIGDSITDARRRLDLVHHLGHGYVRMVSEALAARGVHVVNRGTSGHRTSDLVRRWRADCLDLEPDVLTIFVGINDVWRRYDEGEETPLNRFEVDYRYLVESARESSVGQIVLMEPFLVEVDPGQLTWREDLDPKRAVVAAVAKEFDVPLVPLDSIMREHAAGAGRDAITLDGIHPTPLGHRIIADSWLSLVSPVA